ncbi:amidase family protein [Saliphagus sp. GCM10025308]
MNQVRTAMFDGVQTVFEDEGYDLLVTPTSSIPPIRSNSLDDVRVDGEPVNSRADWLLTWPFNMTGHPAASIPAGLVDGLPVGMQLIGPRFGDETVLTASAAFERHQPWMDWYATVQA